jgi:hypothetical protein
MLTPTTALTLTLTSAHRMVDRIHDHSTGVRTPTQPTGATGFTQANFFMRNVAHLPDRGVTISMQTANLSGWKPQKGVIPVDRGTNGCRPCGTNHFGSASRNELNVMQR